MKLVRCYREGGGQVFIVLTSIHIRDLGVGKYSYQHWIDIFNAMATANITDPQISMFEIAIQSTPGVPVFEFPPIPEILK
jgi:hypothetical protein